MNPRATNNNADTGRRPPLPERIFCLGSATVDVVAGVGQYPQPDTKEEADHLLVHPGGPALTAAAFLAHKGCQVHFCGVCGEDLWGQYLQQEMSRRQIEFIPTEGDSAPGTNVAMVWVEKKTARRTILWRNTSSVDPPRSLSLEARKVLASAAMLYLDGHGGALVSEALEIARRQGLPVFYDGGSAKKGDDLCLPLVDHLIVSSRFAEHYFPDLGPREVLNAMAQRWGPFRSLGLTMGEQGSWACREGGMAEHFPAFPVSALDTNGAGDIFHGALAWGILSGEGWKQIWQEATRLAAESTTINGGGIAWIDQNLT